jgi:YHS domain-containing protein
MARDPVCGMRVDEEKAKYKTVNMGKTYYFCCAMCKEKFEENPHKYTDVSENFLGLTVNCNHNCVLRHG